MNLSAPKVGSLPIKTREKLAAYAADQREQWEREKQGFKAVYDAKRKRHTRPDPKWGYIKKTVDDNFPALKNAARNVSMLSQLL